MKLYLTLLLGLLTFPLLAGCGNEGWTVKVIDRDGKPISGAKILVWSEPVDPMHPQDSARAIGAAWESEKMPFHGWDFTTDQWGMALCRGIPTGHEVARSGGGGTTVISGGGGWRHGGGGIGIISTDTVHYVWKRGDWLAVTITAQGFVPYHFAVRPDSESGDLGSYQLFAKK